MKIYISITLHSPNTLDDEIINNYEPNIIEEMINGLLTYFAKSLVHPLKNKRKRIFTLNYYAYFKNIYQKIR